MQRPFFYQLTKRERRATTAAPMLFKPITVGRYPPVEFVDGGFGNNNPIRLVVSEARRLWPTSPFAVLVSIGTGKPQMGPVGNKAPAILETCVNLATEAEATATMFSQEQKHMVQMHKYFRFNVQHGLEKVETEDWTAMGSVIEPATKTYLESVEDDTRLCTDVLRHPENALVKTIQEQDSIYEIPLKLTPLFSGRESILQKLQAHFLPPVASGGLKVAALYGLGGVGKTQLALKYADIFREKYKYIFWIDAKSRESMEESLAQIGELLLNGKQSTRSRFGIVLDVLRKLSVSNGRWLLIYDNADFLEKIKIEKFLPLESMRGMKLRGHIILTSRDPASARFADPECAFEIGELLQSEAVELLLRSSRQPNDEEHLRDAEEIVGELGCLALAIDQAGSCIMMREKTLQQYLQEYRDQKGTLLDYMPPRHLMAYNDTVFKTWEISFSYIESKNPEATRLLNFLAFFDNTDISTEVLCKGCQTKLRWGAGGALVEVKLQGSTVPSWLVSLFYTNGTFNNFKYESLVQELRRFFLVRQNSDSRNLYIHPLVHEWARLRLSHQDSSRIAYDIIGFFGHATPIADVDDAVAELSNDLALINNYYYSARMWLTGKARNIYEPHISEFIRMDLNNPLISPEELTPEIREAYFFLLLRAPLHSTSLIEIRSFFEYRDRFAKGLPRIEPANSEYYSALDVLSKTRAYAEGSMYYLSMAKARKLSSGVDKMKEILRGNVDDEDLQEQGEQSLNISEVPPSFSKAARLKGLLKDPKVRSALKSSVTAYGKHLAKEKLKDTTRPLRRMKVRVQSKYDIHMDSIKDNNYEAWAEFAEESIAEIVPRHSSDPMSRQADAMDYVHTSRPIHRDARINAAYGEVIIELVVMRYFYDKKEGKMTLALWSPSEIIPEVPLAEKFTDGRKRLWTNLVEFREESMDWDFD